MVVASIPEVDAKILPEDLEGRTLYQCRVWIVPEDEGGFSSHVVSLPGVSSQGETEDEAVENVKDAFQGALKAYEDNSMEIPWLHDIAEEKPSGAREIWVLVDA